MHMNIRKQMYWLYALSLAGFLFSGYLSGTKLLTKSCAFGESCPLFLGYPACYFGFVLFLILFLNSFALISKNKNTINVSIVTSIIGILFAGRFVIQEIAQYVNSGFTWSTLGFPTCAYGLVFFVLIFLFARSIKSKK